MAISVPLDRDDLPTDPLLPVWVTIPFEHPASIDAGETYAIVLPAGPITPVFDPTYHIANSDLDVYGGGRMWAFSRGDNGSGTWLPWAGDMAFRILVVE